MNAPDSPEFPDEPDRAPGCPAPRETVTLFGHEEAERAFAQAWERSQTHHAWLLSGPRGIGKATLAYRMARRVLGARADATRGVLGADPADPVCKRIAAMSHGNLLVLRRPWDSKRNRWRTAILVEEARRLAGFFEYTAAENGWRICIVDAADEMNTSAINAILKTLEEPPQRALLILIAHAPGRLPATIRSRCRQLPLHPLDEALTVRIACQLGANEQQAPLAAKLSGGSPARAFAVASLGGAGLWKQIDRLVGHGGAPDQAAILARRLAPLKAVPQCKLFFELLILRLEDEVRRLAQANTLAGIEPWCALRDTVRTLAVDLERIHLDRAQAVFGAVEKTRQLALLQRAAA